MVEFPVTPGKKKELEERMAALGIDIEEIHEIFVKSSGKGGQKVNKSSTAVVLHYPPEEIEVKCSRSRSQGLNRYYARVILCERLEMKYKTGKKFLEINRLKKRKSRKKKNGEEAKKNGNGPE